jgi:FAD/FMN-containing dehydrogenase
VYLNFLDRDDQEDRVRAAFGNDTLRRLSAIKDEYDPDEVFGVNHGIRPPDRSAEQAGRKS